METAPEQGRSAPLPPPASPASAQPMQITWDDLAHEKVDEKLKQHDALIETRAHYDQAKINAPIAAPRKPVFGFLYNTLVYMTAFGLIGGVLGWGFGILMHLRPNLQAESKELVEGYEKLQREFAIGRWTPTEYEKQKRVMRVQGKTNPFFAAVIDDKLTDAQREAKIQTLKTQDDSKNYIADILFYGIAGLFISACLAMAESLIDRNWQAGVIYASVGAVLGVLGGVAVAFLVDPIHKLIVGNVANPDYTTQVMAHSIEWGVLGLFLTVAPGLLLRNAKRLMIGLAGGAVGGMIGGLLFLPVAQIGFVKDHFAEPELVSRLVGLIAIGALAGLSTGLLEQATKTGWLKVVDGLIAGKQFIIYRNPTYIGSSPVSHIYLFKDPLVGKRHAAVHITRNGCEIEDLPLGAKTQVNGHPINRSRLRKGDQIRVGKTTFVYQERE